MSKAIGTIVLLGTMLVSPILAFAEECLESLAMGEYASTDVSFKDIHREIEEQLKALLARYPARAEKIQHDHDVWLTRRLKLCAPEKNALMQVDLLEKVIREYKNRLSLLQGSNEWPDFEVSAGKYPQYEFDDFDNNTGSHYYPQSIVEYAKYFLYLFSTDQKRRSEYSDSVAGGSFTDLIAMTHVFFRQPYGCTEVWEYHMVIHKYGVDALLFDKNGKKITRAEANRICGKKIYEE